MSEFGIFFSGFIAIFKFILVLLIIALLLPVIIIVVLKLLGALLWSWIAISIGSGIYIGILLVIWAIMIITDK